MQGKIRDFFQRQKRAAPSETADEEEDLSRPALAAAPPDPHDVTAVPYDPAVHGVITGEYGTSAIRSE